jgi:hypothetical protein
MAALSRQMNAFFAIWMPSAESGIRSRVRWLEEDSRSDQRQDHFYRKKRT